MSKKILIVHGWMHSADLYKKLKVDLEKKGLYKVKVYEFPGFGNTPAEKNHKVIDYYTRKMEKELIRGDYDYVIGHSMGGNVLLKAMSGNTIAGKRLDTKLILLSPAYNGITVLKPLMIFLPAMPLLLYFFKKVHGMVQCLQTLYLRIKQFLRLPQKSAAHQIYHNRETIMVTTFLIKCMALFTINSWRKIDNQIVIDTRRADPVVAACTIMELAWDNWRIEKGEWKCGNVALVLGEKDRIITRQKMKRLCDDIGKCQVYVIKGIGHTAVLEAYNKLLKILLRIMHIWETS